MFPKKNLEPITVKIIIAPLNIWYTDGGRYVNDILFIDEPKRSNVAGIKKYQNFASSFFISVRISSLFFSIVFVSLLFVSFVFS